MDVVIIAVLYGIGVFAFLEMFKLKMPVIGFLSALIFAILLGNAMSVTYDAISIVSSVALLITSLTFSLIYFIFNIIETGIH